ncbi:MAG: hypothetical protein FJX42_12310, partial [Alphaproteobacteria bacterium]|nr:hypothetical protein [Alphaproteobacteria bacterium]
MADDSRPPRRDGGKPRWKKRAPPGEGREFKRDEGRDFKRGEGRDFKRDGDRPHWKKRAPGEGRDFKRGEGRDFKRDGDRPRRFERDGDKPHWKKRPPAKGRDFKRDEGRDFKRDEGRDFKRGGDRPHWKKRAPGEGREFKRGEGRDFKGGGGFKRDGDRPRRFGDKGGKPHWKKRGDERAEESFHQRDLVRVAGLTAVKALFAASPERVERLFFAAEMKDAAQGYCRILAHSRKVFRETPAEELDRIAGSPMHGGIVAVARPKPINPFDPDAARRWVKDTPLLPILHGVGNPHNLGAIARTAAFLGLPRLVISDHPAQARLSDAAFRVAEGGFE